MCLQYYEMPTSMFAIYENKYVYILLHYSVDFGNIQSSNTLLDTEAFSARIHPYLTVSNMFNTTTFDSCSWGLGCIKGTTWVEQLLASSPELPIAIPSTLASGMAPAVIKVDYLCPHFRIKSPGSLITSVFIGKNFYFSVCLTKESGSNRVL